MKKVTRILAVALVLSLAAVGCKKKEEQPVPQTPMGQMPMTAPMQNAAPGTMAPHGNTGPKVEKTVVVPDTVKGKWSKVKLAIEDKSSKKTNEFVVGLDSEAKVPNSDLKIAVGEFLPDFKMSDTTLTSGSNDPNNPAVRVEIFENGKSIFKGWLFAKFPTMHPFEHAKYGITLKEGVKS
ncbi:MAG TPA: DUF2155 domain-containing protein [Dissulfurispiraceae bacterium]